MHSRVPSLVAFALVVLVGLGTVFPASPAEAHHTRPPFDITFPQDPEETTFRSSWGEPRPGGRRHKGTDFLAPRMTEVYAVADGIVVRVHEGRTAGRGVTVEHIDGWTSHYIHLNNDNPGTDDGEAPWTLTVAPGIEEGREVRQGQLIGWVGDSGNAEDTTPHTHFELRDNGRSINPYTVLVEAHEEALDRREWLAQMVAEVRPYLID